MVAASDSVTQESGAADGVEPTPRYIGRAFFRVSRGFWTGPTRRNAWALTAGVLAFVLASLVTALGVNTWNKFFFDALEKRTIPIRSCSASPPLLGAGAGVRGRCGRPRAHAHAPAVALAAAAHPLPHRPLADRPAVLPAQHRGRRRQQSGVPHRRRRPTGDRAAGRFRHRAHQRDPGGGHLHRRALVVGGSLDLRPFGVPFVLPGYMVVAVILYAALTSTGIVLVGRPLIRYVETKNTGEAESSLRADARARKRRERSP